MNIFYWVSNYILEFLKLNIFVFGIFNCPGKGKKMQWVPSVVAIVLIGVYAVILRGNEDITLLITFFLMVNVFLALKRKKDIFLVILAFIMIGAIEIFLNGMLQLLLGPNLFREISEDTASFLMNTFSGICLLIAEGILHKKKNRFYFSAKNVTLVFMGLLGMMAYLYPIQYSYEMLETDADMLKKSLLGVSVSSILFFIICLVNLKSINERETYKEKAKSYEEYVTKQELYYKELLQKDNETKQFRHDMLNHLACMRTFLESGQVDKAKNYIDEMLGTVQYISQKIATGNDTIDVVVADIFRNEKNISLKWIGNFPCKTNITDMDLCILFSNLLKNALEAARLYNDNNSKEITVQIINKNQTLIIHIENPCDGNLKKKENKYFTLKEDNRNHGFGMLNIEQVIKKYQGQINFNYSNNIFYSQAILPLNTIRFS